MPLFYIYICGIKNAFFQFRLMFFQLIQHINPYICMLTLAVTLYFWAGGVQTFSTDLLFTVVAYS